MNVYLFDMDGTLTPPRKAMANDMATAIAKLSLKNKVGIVTGSGLNYLLEQTVILGEQFGSNPENIYMMPCNGTKLYRHNSRWRLRLEHEVSMVDAIGYKNYKKLVAFICMKNSSVINDYDICPTGTFVQYRGSMVNWCPIGRDSDDDARSKFVDFDTQNRLREHLRKDLLDSIDFPLEVVLGGSTSLDIYPPGWDKTYCLRHFKEDKNIWFVGDKCVPPGNDASIFTACAPRSFVTTGPKETLEIIYDNFFE